MGSVFSHPPPTQRDEREVWEMCPWHVYNTTMMLWGLGALLGVLRVLPWLPATVPMPLQRRGPGWRWWQFKNRQPYAYTRPFRAWLKTARRFGRFGFGWSFWSCFITLIRGEEDPVNSLLSGALMNVHYRRRYYVRVGRRYNPFKYFNFRQFIIIFVFEGAMGIFTTLEKYTLPPIQSWGPRVPGYVEQPWEYHRRLAEQDTQQTFEPGFLPIVTRMRSALGEQIPKPAPSNSSPDTYAEFRGRRAARVDEGHAESFFSASDVERYKPK